MSSGDLSWKVGLLLCWSLGMRDGQEIIFNLVFRALLSAAGKVGQEKSRRHGRATGVHHCLLQRRQPLSGGYAETWGCGHFALVTNHVPDEDRTAFYLFLEQDCAGSVSTRGVTQQQRPFESLVTLEAPRDPSVGENQWARGESRAHRNTEGRRQL